MSQTSQSSTNNPDLPQWRQDLYELCMVDRNTNTTELCKITDHDHLNSGTLLETVVNLCEAQAQSFTTTQDNVHGKYANESLSTQFSNATKAIKKSIAKLNNRPYSHFSEHEIDSADRLTTNFQSIIDENMKSVLDLANEASDVSNLLLMQTQKIREIMTSDSFLKDPQTDSIDTGNLLERLDQVDNTITRNSKKTLSTRVNIKNF